MLSMAKALIALTLSAAAVLCGGTQALASSGSASDPRGDLYGKPDSGSTSAVDFVSASYAHASGGRLVHTVSVAGSIANPNSSAGSLPMLWIEDPVRSSGTSYCRYFVGRFHGRLGVFTCGYGDRVASARIVRTSAHTIRYEFKAKAIDNPRSYGWAFLVEGPVFGTDAQLDRLPDGDHTFSNHTLR
jgi:hypothetical protein